MKAVFSVWSMTAEGDEKSTQFDSSVDLKLHCLMEKLKKHLELPDSVRYSLETSSVFSASQIWSTKSVESLQHYFLNFSTVMA